MKENQPLNCVGFVYTRLGYIHEERGLQPPTLRQLLKKFDRVDNIASASVLAVIAYSNREPYVAHIALINEDKKTITHRKIDSNIVTEQIDHALDEFTNSDLDFRRVIYLNPKPFKAGQPLLFLFSHLSHKIKTGVATKGEE